MSRVYFHSKLIFIYLFFRPFGALILSKCKEDTVSVLQHVVSKEYVNPLVQKRLCLVSDYHEQNKKDQQESENELLFFFTYIYSTFTY